MNPYVALNSILSLFLLWVFVNHLWWDYRTDTFRDDIFALRDDLFVYAAKGNVRFDHPAYAILRDRMNVILRYAPEFTLSKLIVVLANKGGLKNDEIVRWEAAVAELPKEHQNYLKQANLALTVVVVRHMLYYSFFTFLIARPLIFVFQMKLRKVVERPSVVLTVARIESDTIEKDQHARNGRAATTAMA